MNERVKKLCMLLIYSAGCGLMLFLFTIIHNMANLLFSLLAIVVGFQYFKRVSSTRARVAFVALSVLCFLFAVVIYALASVSQSATGA